MAHRRAEHREPENRPESLPIASEVVIYGTTPIKEPPQAVSEPFGSRFTTQPIPCLDTHGVASTGVVPPQWSADETRSFHSVSSLCVFPALTMPTIVREAAAFAIAGGLAAGLIFNRETDREQRIIRAHSGRFPPELGERPPLQRRPSWSAYSKTTMMEKVEDVPRRTVSESRLQRRPSWSAKFEGHEVTPEQEKLIAETGEKIITMAGKVSPYDAIFFAP